MTKIKKYDYSPVGGFIFSDDEIGSYYKVTDIDPILAEKQAIIDRVCEHKFINSFDIETSCNDTYDWCEMKLDLEENYCPNCGGKIKEVK